MGGVLPLLKREGNLQQGSNTLANLWVLLAEHVVPEEELGVPPKVPLDSGRPNAHQQGLVVLLKTIARPKQPRGENGGDSGGGGARATSQTRLCILSSCESDMCKERQSGARHCARREEGGGGGHGKLHKDKR